MNYDDIFKGDYRRFSAAAVLEATGPFTRSTIVAYLGIVLVGVYLLLHRLDAYPTLPLSQLLWNSLVYSIPSSLVLALDGQSSANAIGQEEDKGSYAASRTFAAKSEAMRRVLRLDSPGFMTNLQRPRSLSGLGMIFGSPASKAMPGLGNWDNSCYQNSILQGLASLTSLYSFLVQAENSIGGSGSRYTSDTLRHLIEELNSPKNAGRIMWTPPALKNMSSWQQQDAQEYYSKVVDELEKELAKSLKSRPSKQGLGVRTLGLGSLRDITPDSRSIGKFPRKKQNNGEAKNIFSELPDELSLLLRNPLEGLLAQRVGCLKCGFVEGLSLIPFNCLTVPLGRLPSYDLGECLDEYTALEEISGVDCPRCTLLRQKEQLERLFSLQTKHPAPAESGRETASSEALQAFAKARLDAVDTALVNEDFSDSTLAKKCMIPSKNRVSTTKTRQAVIARPPRSLVLHVNRSIFDEHSGMLSKNHSGVRFPKVLNLSRWCLGTRDSSGMETWNTDPATSMLTQASGRSESGLTSNTSSTPAASYVLRSIVTHYGRHENGHYIAYRQTPYTKAKDSDHSTDIPGQWWRLSDEDVTPVSEATMLAQGGVFMLFYERIDEVETEALAEAETRTLSQGNVAITDQSSSAEERLASGITVLEDSKAAKAEPLTPASTAARAISDLHAPDSPSDSALWTIVDSPSRALSPLPTQTGEEALSASKIASPDQARCSGRDQSATLNTGPDPLSPAIDPIRSDQLESHQQDDEQKDDEQKDDEQNQTENSDNDDVAAADDVPANENQQAEQQQQQQQPRLPQMRTSGPAAGSTVPQQELSSAMGMVQAN